MRRSKIQTFTYEENSELMGLADHWMGVDPRMRPAHLAQRTPIFLGDPFSFSPLFGDFTILFAENRSNWKFILQNFPAVSLSLNPSHTHSLARSLVGRRGLASQTLRFSSSWSASRPIGNVIDAGFV